MQRPVEARSLVRQVIAAVRGPVQPCARRTVLTTAGPVLTPGARERRCAQVRRRA